MYMYLSAVLPKLLLEEPLSNEELPDKRLSTGDVSVLGGGRGLLVAGTYIPDNSLDSRARLVLHRVN